MKKVRKAYKLLKKDLKRAVKKVVKKKTEVAVAFQADKRFEYIISYVRGSERKATKGYDIVTIDIDLRKDCASVTKNGDYHLLRKDDWTINANGKAKDNLIEIYADRLLKLALTHKCRCKKDQKKKARSMICTAKRVNGRWVY